MRCVVRRAAEHEEEEQNNLAKLWNAGIEPGAVSKDDDVLSW
jgi:hypothetical protein